MLSALSLFYDPLGLVSLLILRGRKILQDLYKERRFGLKRCQKSIKGNGNGLNMISLCSKRLN